MNYMQPVSKLTLNFMPSTSNNSIVEIENNYGKEHKIIKGILEY